ncbi:MAG: hypothetical protein ACXW00_13320 [Methylobacter sp.]
MTYKTRVSYDGYEGLYSHEVTAIVGYMERNDPSELERIIREPPESRLSVRSQGMRDFIADVIAGKKKRNPRKKASTERRDFEIALAIDDLMFFKGYNLTSSRDKDGAAAIVAGRFSVSEEAAIKAYQRFKHIVETPKPLAKTPKP